MSLLSEAFLLWGAAGVKGREPSPPRGVGGKWLWLTLGPQRLQFSEKG